MAQIFRPVPASSVPYAYIRRGEWGFARVEGVGASIPNLAVAAWVGGRITDDDLACLVFASYRANQYWFFENPYFDESPDWYEGQFRLEVYRVYRELVSACPDIDAMGQVIDLLAP